jgi:hypothetical protein
MSKKKKIVVEICYYLLTEEIVRNDIPVESNYRQCKRSRKGVQGE